MVDVTRIQEHATVVTADGLHYGTVDHVEGERLKMTKTDAPDGKHHYISLGLIAGLEEGTLRLSANADAIEILEEDA